MTVRAVLRKMLAMRQAADPVIDGHFGLNHLVKDQARCRPGRQMERNRFVLHRRLDAEAEGQAMPRRP